MNDMLRKALEAAETLPEEAQNELARQIEAMVLERRIAAGESSYRKGGGRPAAEIFDAVIGKHEG